MQDQDNNKFSQNFNRRSLLKGGLALAGLSMMPGITTAANAESEVNHLMARPGKRMLGKLEVSAIGLGVQNMHRLYRLKSV